LEEFKKAVKRATQENCEYILFAGDFISSNGLSIFEKFKGRIEMVLGKNEGNKHGFFDSIGKLKNVSMHGEFFEGEIDGVKFFMNHYPRLSEIAANSGKFDLCIGGHCYKYTLEKVNNSILLCVGNLNGWNEKELSSIVLFDAKNKLTKQILLE